MSPKTMFPDSGEHEAAKTPGRGMAPGEVTMVKLSLQGISETLSQLARDTGSNAVGLGELRAHYAHFHESLQRNWRETEQLKAELEGRVKRLEHQTAAVRTKVAVISAAIGIIGTAGTEFVLKLLFH